MTDQEITFIYETLKHIDTVRALMHDVAKAIIDRAMVHDQSKLLEPERDIFMEYTPKLAALTYGSDEYKQCLAEMKPALDHHYINNRHHPEHHIGGVDSMNLVDLIEMLCDWKAATMRHNNGNIISSLDINRTRFNINKQLDIILRNSLCLLSPPNNNT